MMNFDEKNNEQSEINQTELEKSSHDKQLTDHESRALDNNHVDVFTEENEKETIFTESSKDAVEQSNMDFTKEREAGNIAVEADKGEADESIAGSQSTPVKKQKKNWGQTILSGIIGSILTFGLVTYTPLFGDNMDQNPVTPENEFTVDHMEGDGEAVPTISQQTDGGSSLADMVEDASKAIVGIVNYQKGNNPFSQFSDGIVEGGSGSGVVIKEEGEYAYVVTNNHVIENAEKIEVSLANGETVDATLIGSDALSDLAVLRIDNEHVEKVLPFGDSSAVRAGEQVVAIGNPLGLEFSRTVTQGIISAVDRTIKTRTSAGDWDLHVIQTDAAINPGNSGGPLVNMNGEVIGINSLKIASGGVEGLGFAIPSNDVVPLVEEMVQKGAVARPYIGISMVDVTQIPRSYLGDLPDDVQHGVAVTDVDSNSPAGRGGIQPGDIVVGMNGEEVQSIDELRTVLYKDLKVGDDVTFDVYRGQEKLEVDITLTSDTME